MSSKVNKKQSKLDQNRSGRAKSAKQIKLKFNFLITKNNNNKNNINIILSRTGVETIFSFNDLCKLIFFIKKKFWDRVQYIKNKAIIHQKIY